MEGVTILNQYMTYDYASWILIAIIILALIFGISINCIISDAFGSTVKFVSFFGMLFSFVAMLMLFLGGQREETGLYKYEVIIDEGVSFVELNEHYDFIEQRGEIYILKDKEE